MIYRTRKSALAAALAAGLLTVFTATALASGDSGDGFNPAGTNFTATSGKVALQGTVNGIHVTVTCAGSSFAGTTSQPDTWSITLPKPPAFSGCTISAAMRMLQNCYITERGGPQACGVRVFAAAVH